MTRDSPPADVEAAKKDAPKPAPKEAPRKEPKPNVEEVSCRLVGTGGGFTWRRPGRCYYECSNGLIICKEVLGYQFPCPDGPRGAPLPIPEISELRDCP